MERPRFGALALHDELLLLPVGRFGKVEMPVYAPQVVDLQPYAGTYRSNRFRVDIRNLRTRALLRAVPSSGLIPRRRESRTSAITTGPAAARRIGRAGGC
jgi:hypothetical protein